MNGTSRVFLAICAVVVLGVLVYGQTPAPAPAPVKTGTQNNPKPGAPPLKPQGPKRTCETVKAPGSSFVAIELQTYHKEVDLAGTPWMLHYTSLRAPGRRAGDAHYVRVTPPAIAANLQRVEVAWTIAGKTVTTNYAASTNLVYACKWDGRDDQGQEVAGGRVGTLRLGMVHILPYPYPGERCITNWISVAVPSGVLPATEQGLGGWTITPQDMLDTGVNVLHQGDGLMREVACVVTNAAGELLVSSEDGGEVGVFDASGRHLRTVDAWTGVTNLTFAYASYGGQQWLTAIRDMDGLETLIERDGAGKPLAVVGPYGQRTALYLNGDGYLWKVVNPAGETNQYGYGMGGLLTSATDRRGYTSTQSHDGEGRVTNAVDAVGGGHTLWRGEPYHPGVVGWAPDRVGYYVDVTWPEGQTSSHGMYTLWSGVRYRDIEWPDGTRLEIWGTPYSEAQRFVTAEAEWTVRRTPDARFGMTAPVDTEQRVKLPSGLTWTGGEERQVGLAAGGDPLNVLWVTNTVTENGRKSMVSYVAANRVLNATSPSGRQSQATLDAQGRVVEVEIPGLYPLGVTYDADGRPLTLTQGTGAASRVVQIGYDNSGYLRAVTNGLGERVELQSDAIGRVTNVVLADEGTIGLRYDRSEEVVGVTPPEREEHALGYSAVHLLTNYVPPVVGSATNAQRWTYNLNRQLTGVSRADGTTITNGYDSKGRLSVAAWPEDRVTVSYDAASRVSSVTASNGASLGYSYDGFLLTNVVVCCAGASGTLAYTYSSDLWLTNLAVNGLSVGYGRDADGLLVRAGDLALNRRADNGFLTDTVLGNVRDEMSYNGFGQVTNYTAAYGGTNLLSLKYEHDLLGRITSRVETIQGETKTYGYSYDARGQLVQVTTNGAVYSQYAYDSNGNRTSSVVAASVSAASYDGQDRLLTNGTTAYQWDANGTLTHRIAGGQKTEFRYNAMGRLLSVSSSVTVVEYELDALGRRVGKKVSGVVQRRWLYQSFLRPALELDADGQVMSRFVYATGVNVPDYMVRTGRTYRIIKDHLGSVRLVVDAQSGAVVQRMNYDEWGRVTRDTNPGFQPFGFAGGLYDADTDLVRFGHRDYDPEVGRWTAKDPILFGGGQANLYVYCGNDPVNFRDPFGDTTKWRSRLTSIASATLNILKTYLGNKANLPMVGNIDKVATPLMKGAVLIYATREAAETSNAKYKKTFEEAGMSDPRLYDDVFQGIQRLFRLRGASPVSPETGIPRARVLPFPFPDPSPWPSDNSKCYTM